MRRDAGRRVQRHRDDQGSLVAAGDAEEAAVAADGGEPLERLARDAALDFEPLGAGFRGADAGEI